MSKTQQNKDVIVYSAKWKPSQYPLMTKAYYRSKKSKVPFVHVIGEIVEQALSQKENQMSLLQEIKSLLQQGVSINSTEVVKTLSVASDGLDSSQMSELEATLDEWFKK